MRFLKLFTPFVCFFAILFSVAPAGAQGVSITPYGFLKLDMAYDQARTNYGDYVMLISTAGTCLPGRLGI